MKWTRGTQNDDVVDVSGRPGGAGMGTKIGVGGIGVAVVVFLIARFTGVDLSSVMGSSGGDPQTQAQNQTPAPTQEFAELKDMIRDVMKHIQDTWTRTFQEQVRGEPYRRAKLYIFSQGIDTACGHATAQVGPFYCPGDEQAYIDLHFYAMLDELGGPGDFAQMYVLAHEIGHHVQKVLGAEQKVKRNNPGETDLQRSVRIELQADCYAGIWGNAARDRLEAGDLEEALRAAKSIGDDALQRRGGGTVNPESFSHGSSEQRMKWFRRGFDSGRIDACDTSSGPL